MHEYTAQWIVDRQWKDVESARQAFQAAQVLVKLGRGDVVYSHADPGGMVFWKDSGEFVITFPDKTHPNGIRILT